MVRVDEYEAALQVEGAQDPSDISVGVLAEGFDREESDANVDEAVRDALEEFEAEGATVEAVSIPYHIDAEAILFCVAMGETTALVESEGIGKFGKGFRCESVGRYPRPDVLAVVEELKTNVVRRPLANDIAPVVKCTQMAVDRTLGWGKTISQL